MTTFFPSKNSALKRAVYYARGKVDLEINELRKLKNQIIDQFGFSQEAEVYEFENEKGEDIQVGVCETPRGWNLWLISKNGVTMRV